MIIVGLATAAEVVEGYPIAEAAAAVEAVPIAGVVAAAERRRIAEEPVVDSIQLAEVAVSVRAAVAVAASIAVEATKEASSDRPGIAGAVAPIEKLTVLD